MTYLMLLVAVVAEVVGTSFLKHTEQFTKLGPTAIVALAYATAFYLLSRVVQDLPVGITYAIWAGLGIVLVTAVSGLTLRQVPDPWALVGTGFILAGVVIVNVLSTSVSH